ncbi:MAG: hypothetical protein LBB73_05940 [Dysgonamonadaceae bacterium]|nr:hypothetical protein [Dysgonamonadaceae bacterium]
MKKTILFLTAGLLLLSSCAPKISTRIAKSYATLDYLEEVRIFGLQDAVPSGAETLGTVKIGDTGFSTDCNFETVIDKAKNEARKVGGNALKITKHTPPSFWGSSCHRITATILKVENFDSVISEAADSSLTGAGYALLHVYRNGGPGALMSYDLHLGDTVICRLSDRSKKTVTVYKDGLNTLWARTEKKVEIPIDIQFGKEYYIRCGIATGFFVGHPQIEMIDSKTGKLEFQAISNNKTNE